MPDGEVALRISSLTSSGFTTVQRSLVAQQSHIRYIFLSAKSLCDERALLIPGSRPVCHRRALSALLCLVVSLGNSFVSSLSSSRPGVFKLNFFIRNVKIT